MSYQKELKKVKILLGLGVVFTLFIFIGACRKAGIGEVLTGGDFYILLCTLVYPLGVVYNWRNMFGYIVHRPDRTHPTRYYTRAERADFHYSNFIGFFIKCGFAIALGWLPGLYYAFRTLSDLKRQDEEQQLDN